MIGGEVRHHGEVADKFLRPAELEAGEFKNDKVVLFSRRAGDGVADIAASHYGIAEPLKVVTYH